MRPRKGGCIAQMAAAIPAGELSNPTPMTVQRQGSASEYHYSVHTVGCHCCMPRDTRAEATALNPQLILQYRLAEVSKT